MTEKLELGVSVALIKNDLEQYLFVQEKDVDVYGLWGPPGGHIEAEETPSQAAIREVKEELSLDIEIVSENDPVLETFIEGTTIPYSAFAARILGGQIILQEEELITSEWMSRMRIEVMSSRGLLRSINGLMAIKANDENIRY